MVSVWRLLFIAGAATAAGDQTLPLLASCSEPDEIVAAIHSSDAAKVRYSLGGGAQTCYAVSVTVDGKAVEGWLLGETHPAVAAFERDARARIPQIAEAPKPEPEADNSLMPPGSPTSFAGLRAVDVKGRRVDLEAMRAPYLIVYFWSTTDRHSIADAEALEYVYGHYHPKGVDVVGIASGPSASRVRQVAQEQEYVWPQIFDSGEIANQYHVTPARPYFILDRQRSVVAALKSAGQIDLAMQRLRKK
jgi:peroxiredoxin